MTTEERLRSLLATEVGRHGVHIIEGRIVCACGFDPNTPLGIEGQIEPWFAPHVAERLVTDALPKLLAVVAAARPLLETTMEDLTYGDFLPLSKALAALDEEGKR